jgi:hypothetical protein
LNRSGYLLLLITIALTAIPYGTVHRWWIATFECAIFLIATLALVEFRLNRDWNFNLALVGPLLLLALFAVIQSLPLISGPGPLYPRTSISADPYSTRLFAIQLMALVFVVLLLLHYLSTKVRLRRLMYLIIGVGLASAVFGIIRHHLQTSPGFGLPALGTDGRSFGQFINRNHFAVLMEMSLGLTLGLIVAEIGWRRRRFVLLTIGAFLWIAIIYSSSRGGIVAALCQLFFVGAFLGPQRGVARDDDNSRWRRTEKLVGGVVMRAFLIVCLIGMLIYGVSWIGGEDVVSNLQLAVTDFSQQQMGNNVNSSRREIWSASWQMFKAHPIVGTGFGGYWIGITRYHHASGRITPQQAHNDYLELMASGGLFACALGIWFVINVVKSARRGLGSTDTDSRGACLGALAGIFAVAIHSFFDFGLHITINAVVFFVLVAIVVQAGRLARGPAQAAASAF